MPLAIDPWAHLLLPEIATERFAMVGGFSVPLLDIEGAQSASELHLIPPIEDAQ